MALGVFNEAFDERVLLLHGAIQPPMTVAAQCLLDTVACETDRRLRRCAIVDTLIRLPYRAAASA
jgi:hypothetical protein